MKKSVMILGAGRGQIGLYKAAKKLGYESIAASIEGDYPGFDHADRICTVDIRDTDRVLECASSLNIDGIATSCIDIGLPAIGVVHDNLGLPGLSLKAALSSTDKLRMKDALMENSVRTARYCAVSSAKDLEKAMTTLKLPLITKPADLWSSIGINVANSRDELVDCYQKTMAETKKEYCIVEEYLDGYECSATAFISGGKPVFVIPMGDLRYGENDEYPVGHFMPLQVDVSMNDQIKKLISDGAAALELDDCAVNADIMIYEGRPYILEITGRIGANTIPELTSHYIGSDIHEWILQAAVGDRSTIDSFDEKSIPATACMGRMLFSEDKGMLKQVEYTGDSRDLYSGDSYSGRTASQIWFFTKPGDTVQKFSSAADCIGQVVVQGENYEKCEKNMEQTLEDINCFIE